MSPHTSPTEPSARAILVGLLVATLAITGIHLVTRTPAAAEDATTRSAPRTWVVDAVDDAQGSRWQSADTLSPDLTITVGDTIEWEAVVGTAGQGHDLISSNDADDWVPTMSAYVAPGGETDTYSYTFETAGTYAYLCSLHTSGTFGMLGSITVQEPGGDNLPPTANPSIEATATPAASSRQVAFSAEVTTTGQMKAYSHGLTAYPGLTGTAELVRRRDETDASIEVSGLKPGAAHLVHAHEQSCADNLAGAHFRFDETQPFREDNEIWLPFTSDDQGRSAIVARTRPQRAGDRAVSLVVHDPDNPSLRIGCADLGPGTAGLSYAWSFGDDTTGVGADPDHTYAADGTYTATVAVSSEHAAQGAPTVTDTVEVVVRSAASQAAPRTRITRGPGRVASSSRARFWFAADTPGSHFECRLDSRAWIGCPSGATYVNLQEGVRVLEVRATDRAGRTDASPAIRRWTVDTTGPRVSGVRPSATTRDRTPTIRAIVTDRYSSVRRGSLVLRLDERRLTGLRHHARTDRVTATLGRALAPGRHRVRLIVVDALGNRTSRTWQFRVNR